MGAQNLPRGTRVRVKLGAIDDIALDVGGTVLEVLDQVDTTAPADSEAEEEDENAAGPIAIAVDVNEVDPSSTDNSTP